MVGFSLIHIHPIFAVLGAVCAYTLMLWLVPAIVCLVSRRKRISGFDVVMMAFALLALLAVVTPDTLLASGH
jgi:ABC-type uncharacterized transport system permease subunit